MAMEGSIDALRAAQFEEASEAAVQNTFYNSSNASDYHFGEFAYGLDALKVVDPEGEQTTLLDIGSGNGTYLSETLKTQDGLICAVGLSAVQHYPEAKGVGYVYGDIQRPETWTPEDILTPASVDVAVTYLTFMHLADPLAALRNTFALLKPGGHLFTDEIVLPMLDSPNASELTLSSGDGLLRLAGKYGCTVSKRSEGRLSAIVVSGHLMNLDSGMLDNIETVVVQEPFPSIAYRMA